MKKIRPFIYSIVILTITLAVFLSAYSENINKGLSENIIRLHVLANSDSDEDQSLKLRVRDRVLEYMQDKLKDSNNIEESKAILNDNMESIKKIAEQEIESQGKNYDVKVSLGNYPFPTKEYGNIALPAGVYQALQVKIGKAEGQNWWCVLFPPLCFVDLTHGSMPSESVEHLKDSLSNEEYGIIVAADDDGEVPVRIKFKVVEFFQESKIKFTGAFSKITDEENTSY